MTFFSGQVPWKTIACCGWNDVDGVDVVVQNPRVPDSKPSLKIGDVADPEVAGSTSALASTNRKAKPAKRRWEWVVIFISGGLLWG
jgi:hypothetical protein